MIRFHLLKKIGPAVQTYGPSISLRPLGTAEWLHDILRVPHPKDRSISRVGKGGRTRKVVRGDSSVRKNRVHSFHLDLE
ncbi:MAG: hypothetical protein QMB38_10140 [Ascidiaceihabitans sp.]|jgi:hypothetical protein